MTSLGSESKRRGNLLTLCVVFLIAVLIGQNFLANAREQGYQDYLDSWGRTAAKPADDNQIRTHLGKAAGERRILVTDDDIQIERSDQRVEVDVRYRVRVGRFFWDTMRRGTHRFIAEPSPFEQRLKSKFESEQFGRVKEQE